MLADSDDRKMAAVYNPIPVDRKMAALECVAVCKKDGKLSKAILKHLLTVHVRGLVHCGPERVLMPKKYVTIKEAVSNFHVRDDDVWVMSFPKSGTTWTQEMVWFITHDMDKTGAKESLITRSPQLELSCISQMSLSWLSRYVLPGYYLDSTRFIDKLPSPRVIKCHLAYHMQPRQLMENKAKIIYVARNPKDVCISYYHYLRMTFYFRGSLEEFAHLFLQDSLPFMPYWSHVKHFWERRHDLNVLFITYEDMKQDLAAVIRRTSLFLNKPLTDDQVATLTQHLSFSNMKSNAAVNYDDLPGMPYMRLLRNPARGFMRSGEMDQWRTDMTTEMVTLFDEWIEKNTRGTDLRF